MLTGVGGTHLPLILTSPARSGSPWESHAGTFGNRAHTTHTGVVSSPSVDLSSSFAASADACCAKPRAVAGGLRVRVLLLRTRRSAGPPLHGQPGFARSSSVSWRGGPCLWSRRRGVDDKLYPFICSFHGLQPQNPSISTSVGLGKTAPNSQGLTN